MLPNGRAQSADAKFADGGFALLNALSVHAKHCADWLCCALRLAALAHLIAMYERVQTVFVVEWQPHLVWLAIVDVVPLLDQHWLKLAAIVQSLINLAGGSVAQ